MRFVFVDTSGWVALKHRGDALWAHATTLNRALLDDGVQYVTSNFVLDEAYTLLRKRTGHAAAVELGEEVRSSRLVTVQRVSEAMEERAWGLFKRYDDKTFSFTDCTSFILMEERGMYEVFTYDHHFEQMGFRVLLR